uniref:Rhodanese domain-containing protein n=1 Tax=Rhizophora mucronata TaxID=61149 RepID=A0A2P2KR42_RHIMU
MAGIASCCSTLSSRSNFQASLFKFETHRRRAIPSKLTHLRSIGVRAEVNYVNAEEAKKLLSDQGYVVLDVRDKTQYDRAHIKSCSHVPLFIENQDNDFGTIIKRTVHNNFSGLFFGLAFTKLNPQFVESVKSQFSSDSKLLVVCQEGLRSITEPSLVYHIIILILVRLLFTVNLGCIQDAFEKSPLLIWFSIHRTAFRYDELQN